MASEGAAADSAERSSFGRELRRTWAGLSVMLTAASIWALIVRSWGVDLSGLMQAFIDGYQAIFHWLISIFFGWFPYPLSPLAKDLLVIWFAVGTSLARTFYFLFETGAGRGTPKWSSPLITRGADDVVFKTPVVRSVLLLVAVLLWPIAMVLLLRKPKLCFSRGGQKYALVGGVADIPTYGGAGATYVVKHDLRMVFGQFLLLVVICVVGFSVLNALGLSLF